MAEKKKHEAAMETAQVDTSLPNTPKVAKEKLIAVRAFAWFSDGNLREAMEKYGYECEWKEGEVRSLPSWLIQRCLNSGAELEQPE
jgi:hypothetical protein